MGNAPLGLFSYKFVATQSARGRGLKGRATIELQWRYPSAAPAFTRLLPKLAAAGVAIGAGGDEAAEDLDAGFAGIPGPYNRRAADC